MNLRTAPPPVMLVDDNSDDALLFVRLLKNAGVPNPVVHLRNGGDAFMYLKQFCVGEKPASECPRVVFLDINMPNLSGFDVLAWARQQPALQGVRIVMLSGANEPWDAQIAAKLGADDFLKKFPSPEVVGDLVARLLREDHAKTRAASRP